MSEACVCCGAAQLVTVRFPGHDDIEAVLCLACSTVQPARLEATAQPRPPR